jgi:hypothetical protein
MKLSAAGVVLSPILGADGDFNKSFGLMTALALLSVVQMRSAVKQQREAIRALVGERKRGKQTHT